MSDSHEPSRYLSAEWVAYLNDSGEEYYYNLYTAETTWDLPTIETEDVGHLASDEPVESLHSVAEVTSTLAEVAVVDNESSVEPNNNTELTPACTPMVENSMPAPVPEETPAPVLPAVDVSVPVTTKVKPAKPPKAIKPSSLACSVKTTAVETPADSTPTVALVVEKSAEADTTVASTDNATDVSDGQVKQSDTAEHNRAKSDHNTDTIAETDDIIPVHVEVAPIAAVTDTTTADIATVEVEVEVEVHSEQSTASEPVSVTTNADAHIEPAVDPSTTTIDATESVTAPISADTESQGQSRPEKTTSTGKVSALAKMFSRPTSNNSVAPVSPVNTTPKKLTSSWRSRSSSNSPLAHTPERKLSMQPLPQRSPSDAHGDTDDALVSPSSVSRSSRKFDSHVRRRVESDDAADSDLFDEEGLLVLPALNRGGETPPSTQSVVPSEQTPSLLKALLSKHSGEVHGIKVPSIKPSGRSSSAVTEDSATDPAEHTTSAECTTDQADPVLEESAGDDSSPVEAPVIVTVETAVVVPTESVSVKPPRPPPPPMPSATTDTTTNVTNGSDTNSTPAAESGVEQNHPPSSADQAPVEPIIPFESVSEAAEETETPVLSRAATAPLENTSTLSATEPTTSNSTTAATSTVPDSVPVRVKPPKPPKRVPTQANLTTDTAGSNTASADSSAVPSVVSVPKGSPEATVDSHRERPLPPLPATCTTTNTTSNVDTDKPATETPAEESTSENDAAPAWLTHQSANINVVSVGEVTRNGHEEAPVDSDTEYGDIVSENTTPRTPHTPQTPHSIQSSNSNISELTASPVPVHEGEGSAGGVENISERTPVVQATLTVTAVHATSHTVASTATTPTADLAPPRINTHAVPVATLAADSCTSPVVQATPVVKPPKPAKRVPVPTPTPAAAVSVAPVIAAVEVSVPNKAENEEVSKVSGESSAVNATGTTVVDTDLSTRPLPPSPKPPASTVVAAEPALALYTLHADSVDTPLDTELSPSSDEDLSAALAGVHIIDGEGEGGDVIDEESDYGDIQSDTSEAAEVEVEGSADLDAELSAVEVNDTADHAYGTPEEEAEAEGMCGEDEYSTSREKHESLHLPRPPSKLPPPPPVPVGVSGEKSGASGVSGASPVNPFDEDDDESAELDNINSTAIAASNGVRNAPGQGKIGGGRSMGAWGNATATVDPTGASATRRPPLQYDNAPVAAPPTGRSIGAWNQPGGATSNGAISPPGQRTGAVPVATPVGGGGVGGGILRAWGGSQNTTTSEPNTTSNASTAANGTSSRGASPGPGARQMSPLLAIALSKKSEAEAARGRSPAPGQPYSQPPAQSTQTTPAVRNISRDSFMPMTVPATQFPSSSSSARNSPFRERADKAGEFEGFDGGRPSDVLGLHYAGMTNPSSAVGGSMGSNYNSDNNSPGGSGREDAPQSYMQRTGTGQVRKRNPRPSEVLTGLEDGMEVLNSIALKKLMRVGVKYLPAKEALQRCVITTSAVNHYYNALGVVRTGMLAGLGMDPFGAQLWSPRITSRIKSWLPNLLDKDTKDYHTGYIMLVQYQRLADNQLISWQLTLRYSVFRALNNKIAKFIQGTSIDSRVHFPSKVTTFFTGISDKTRTDRMNQLDAWMREILNSALIMTIPEVADAVLEVLEVESRVSD